MEEEAERAKEPERIEHTKKQNHLNQHEQSSYIFTETYAGRTGPGWIWIRSSMYILWLSSFMFLWGS